MQTSDLQFYDCLDEKHKTQESVKAMNRQIVRLIEEKLLPLNRLRYVHLQKINKTLRKDQFQLSKSNLSFTDQTLDRKQKLKIMKKIAYTSRKLQNNSRSSDLLCKLKSMKQKEINWKNELSKQKDQKCLSTQVFDQNKNMSEIVLENNSDQLLFSRSSLSKRQRRKRNDLLSLAERAQAYLRIKKKELKIKYNQKEQEGQNRRRHPIKLSDIQILLTKFGRADNQQGNEKQIQRQLLKDIRSNMLEHKINRMKKDINHKKIVQMR